MSKRYYELTLERAQEIVDAATPSEDSELTVELVRQYCQADWPEGDEHQQWLNQAPAQEIAMWVEMLAEDDGLLCPG